MGLAWKVFSGGHPRERTPIFDVRNLAFGLEILIGSRLQALWFSVPIPGFHR